MSNKERTQEIAFIQRMIRVSRKAGIPYTALSFQLTQLLKAGN